MYPKKIPVPNARQKYVNHAGSGSFFLLSLATAKLISQIPTKNARAMYAKVRREYISRKEQIASTLTKANHGKKMFKNIGTTFIRIR
mmetsp:Transcript_66901/g.105865  ORF Transcript_66901/g.105865 Transcript_66901/m.105865 type:complete len:87 (+) Transcript_66901:705-965(+)